MFFHTAVAPVSAAISSSRPEGEGTAAGVSPTVGAPGTKTAQRHLCGQIRGFLALRGNLFPLVDAFSVLRPPAGRVNGSLYGRLTMRAIFAALAAFAVIAAGCGSGSGPEVVAPAATGEPEIATEAAVPAATPDPAELPDPVDGHVHDCPGPEWVRISHDECVLPVDGADAVPTASPTPGSPEFPDSVDGHTHECPPGFEQVGHDQCVGVAELAPAVQDSIDPDAPSCTNGMVRVDLDYDGTYDSCGMPIPAGLTTAEVGAARGAPAVVRAATSHSSSAELVTAAAQRCFEHHRFGAQPVDVAKTADGQAVLAQTSWNWHDSIGCYLTLDHEALSVLRAAPVPQDLPSAPTDASRQCFEYHKFGEYPVDVAKTADRETVIARLSWGYHDSIGCYLVLDDAALTALQSAASVPPPAPGWYHDPACRHTFRLWDGLVWTNRVIGQGGESADPIRPGDADRLARPGVGFVCAASDPIMDIAGFRPDPTCRYDDRWWADRRWTVRVHSGGEVATDFLLVGDGYLPLPQTAVDCDSRVAPSFAFPCDNPVPSGEPGVGVGDDGLPCATRLPEMGDPLFWNSWTIFDSYQAWTRSQRDDYYYKPEGVSDAEALGYITACLRGGYAGGDYSAYPVSYPSYVNGPAPPPGYTWPGEPLSVFQECADAWIKAAPAINFGGMKNSLTCVYDAYLDFHLRQTSDGVLYERNPLSVQHFEEQGWSFVPDPIAVQMAEEQGLDAGRHYYRVVGWADACSSWVDPVPDRSFVEKCRWLRGHYIGHNEALQREAANGDCANVRRLTYRLEQLNNTCIHRYALVAMVKRWIRDEAIQLGLGVPPEEYLPDYRARPFASEAC